MSRLHYVLGAAVIATATAGAQDSPSQAACRRCLGGHRFMDVSLVPDPFIATHFTNSAGFGLAHNISTAVQDQNGTPVGALKSDIGFILLDFRYEYAFNKWLAARASLTGAGRVGTSAQAILASGVSATYGGSLGATVRAWHGSNTQLSFTGDYVRDSDYLVDPFGFAQGIIESGLSDSTRALLLQSKRLGRVVGGVRAAWAPMRWLGLNGVYEIGSSDTGTGGKTTVSDYGVVAGVDFHEISAVPLGVVLGARGQRNPRGSGTFAGNTTAWTGGLHYTGRSTFTIGVEGSWAKYNLTTGEAQTVNVTQGRFVTRLDF